MRLVDGASSDTAASLPNRGGSFADPVEEAFLALLEEHPDARVGAIADSPTGLLPLPPGVPVGPQARRLAENSVADLVVPADRSVVARLWWQARTFGMASGAIRLQHDPGKATVSFFDLRPRYGVMVAVAVEGVAVLEPIEVGASESFAGSTRYARVLKDGMARLLDVDEAFERILGYHREELIGRRVSDFVHPDDQEAAVEQWIRMCSLPGPNRPLRLRHRTKDGRWIWLEVTNHNRLDDPRHGDVVADMVDVTDEVAIMDAVRARQQLLEQVTAAVPIGLLHADTEGRLLYANYQLTDLTGLRTGSKIGDWPGVATPHHRSLLLSAVSSAVAGSPAGALVETIGALGEIRHCSLTVRPLFDDQGEVTGVTGSVEDVTASVAERRELEVRAATDALTNCLNRSATLSVIQEALRDLASGDGASNGVAVIFVDVDNLKEVNDRLGHSAGDALLVELATRLRAAVRSRDVVGRFGGDEFVLVATHVGSREHALTLAHWVSSRVLRGFTFDSHLLDIRASLGVAWTGSDSVQASWLVGQADRAMYESKRAGRCEPVLAG